jgi:hypothetical protein
MIPLKVMHLPFLDTGNGTTIDAHFEPPRNSGQREKSSKIGVAIGTNWQLWPCRALIAVVEPGV